MKPVQPLVNHWYLRIADGSAAPLRSWLYVERIREHRRNLDVEGVVVVDWGETLFRGITSVRFGLTEQGQLWPRHQWREGKRPPALVVKAVEDGLRLCLSHTDCLDSWKLAEACWSERSRGRDRRRRCR